MFNFNKQKNAPVALSYSSLYNQNGKNGQNEPSSSLTSSTSSTNSSNLKSYVQSSLDLSENSKPQILPNDIYVFEEQGEDCVYQITFKKEYKLPTQTQQVDSNNNSSYVVQRLFTQNYCIYENPRSNNNLVNNNNNTNKDGLVYKRIKIKQLKYASLKKFIEHLTDEETGKIESNLVQIFLATYRSFSDTKTVLNQIKIRYEKILPASLEMTEDVRLEHLKSFRLILKMWLENYSEDFNEPNDYSNLNELKHFALKYFPDSDLSKLIQAKYEEFESNLNKTTDTLTKSSIESNKILKTHRRSSSNVATNQIYSNSNLVKSNQLSKSQTNLLNNFNQTNNENKPDSSSILTSTLTSTSTSTSKSSQNILFSIFLQNNKKYDLTSTSSTQSANKDFSISLQDSFMHIDSNYIAEQLTYIDKCLFQKVYAHHCLGSVWGTRYQKVKQQQSQNETSSQSQMSTSSNSATLTPLLSDKFAAIRSFITHFNLVTFVVQSTILEKVDLKPYERSRIILKWIEVAQACRLFKNFSSLNAIVQGLNTQCISRLEKTWNEIPSDVKAQFVELTEMFSQDQNQKIFREILMKDLKEYKELFETNDSIDSNSFLNLNNFNNQTMEGTAKYADINSGINATLSRKMKEKMIKQQTKKQFREPLGTIPFLGTFLKDLEYINAQTPKHEKGLINLQQKRKEFEVIAQIKLLQQASQLYNLKQDPNFKAWLDSQTILKETQLYEFSYLIEPKLDPDSLNGSNRKTKQTNPSYGSRSESIESLNSYVNSNKTPSLKQKKFTYLGHSRNSSMASSDLMDNLNSNSPLSNPKNSLTNSSHADNQSSNTSASMDGFTTLPKYNRQISPASSANKSEIQVKVNIESVEGANDSGILYKKMMINDKYRTRDVKRLILEKFFQNPDSFENYSLVQILNQNSNEINNQQTNELIINDNCNVFYAAKTVKEMQFVLRPRTSSSFNKIQMQNGQRKDSNSSTLRNSTAKVILNTIRSSSLSRDGLPPQSPNYHQQSRIKSQQNGNLANWKIFKKILS